MKPAPAETYLVRGKLKVRVRFRVRVRVR